MGFIPKVPNPYPDELLYSWIHRISKVNELNIKTFSDAYLGKSHTHIGNLSLDVKNEFLYFYQNLYAKKRMDTTFLSLSNG